MVASGVSFDGDRLNMSYLHPAHSSGGGNLSSGLGRFLPDRGR